MWYQAKTYQQDYRVYNCDNVTDINGYSERHYNVLIHEQVITNNCLNVYYLWKHMFSYGRWCIAYLDQMLVYFPDKLVPPLEHPYERNRPEKYEYYADWKTQNIEKNNCPPYKNL